MAYKIKTSELPDVLAEHNPQDFMTQNGNIQGTYYDVPLTGAQLSSTGENSGIEFPAETEFRYVVTSYGTPVGGLDVDQKAHISPVRYSTTTSRLQELLRTAWTDRLVTTEARWAR